MAKIEVTLKNWKTMNPRNDVKKSTWFRLEHSLIDDPDFYHFSDAEFKAWIYILSMASRKSSATVFLDTEHADRAGRVQTKDLVSTLEKLKELDILTVHVPNALRGRHSTYVRDETNVTNETEDIPPDGDSLSPEKLAAMWNDSRKTLPECKILSEPRKRKAKAQTRKYPDLEHWRESLKKLTESEFCLNQWQPNFDDWMDEQKRLKALEGKYDPKARGSPKTTQTAKSEYNRSIFEAYDAKERELNESGTGDSKAG